MAAGVTGKLWEVKAISVRGTENLTRMTARRLVHIRIHGLPGLLGEAPLKAQQFFAPFSIKTAVVREVAQHVLEFFEYLILLSAFWAGYMKTGSNVLSVCSLIIGLAILVFFQSLLPQTILHPANPRREWVYNIAVSLGMISLGAVVMMFSVKVIAGLILTAIS